MIKITIHLHTLQIIQHKYTHIDIQIYLGIRMHYIYFATKCYKINLETGNWQLKIAKDK